MKERYFENTENPKFSFRNGIIGMTRKTQEKNLKTNEAKKRQRYLKMASHLEKAHISVKSSPAQSGVRHMQCLHPHSLRITDLRVE